MMNNRYLFSLKHILAMKKNMLIVTFLLAAYVTGSAQTQFISSGRIEYEKKLNLQKEIEDDHWLDNYKDKIPKFRTTYYNLYFTEGKTRFEKGTEVDVKIPFFGDDPSADDIIFSDLKQGIFLKKQNVADESFLIADSIRNIKWQMTNELRDIAGFECHKAVGKILDSVYVIAFYTDQITVSGGPLSYSNLPGMILGVAIPRCNLTIFATKVELMEPKAEKMVPPTGKMKKADYKSLFTILQRAASDWGSYGRKFIINALL